jgi:quercetin 2,3-dioxygenase
VITIRRSSERGHANHGWLNSRHSFSFAEYYNPSHMGFQSLRVINEDRVAPGKGFGTHPHRNMEILSYVVSGQLAHKDSMGNGRTILPGEMQLMSAGTGVTHSEFNPSSSEEVHFLQIWIQPSVENTPPSYNEWKPTSSDKGITLVASHEGISGSMKILQDVLIYVGTFAESDRIEYAIPQGRHAWLQLVLGEIIIGEVRLSEGDGISLSKEPMLSALTVKESTFLLFDLG